MSSITEKEHLLLRVNTAYNHATNSNLMFCLIIDGKIQIISADSGSDITDYKIADTVLLLFEK